MGAWVKPNDTNSGRRVISLDDHGFERSLGIDARGDAIGWSSYTGRGVLGSRPVVPDQWAFLAVAYDEDNASTLLYVDGETVTGGTGGADHMQGEPFNLIGGNPLPLGDGCCVGWFSGVIDEVFFDDEALSKTDLDALRAGQDRLLRDGEVRVEGHRVSVLFDLADLPLRSKQIRWRSFTWGWRNARYLNSDGGTDVVHSRVAV